MSGSKPTSRTRAFGTINFPPLAEKECGKASAFRARRAARSTPLLHRHKFAQHLLRLHEISGTLVGEPASSAHLLEHAKFFRSRPLQIAHQRQRDALALRLLPLTQHRNLPPP